MDILTYPFHRHKEIQEQIKIHHETNKGLRSRQSSLAALPTIHEPVEDTPPRSRSSVRQNSIASSFTSSLLNGKSHASSLAGQSVNSLPSSEVSLTSSERNEQHRAKFARLRTFTNLSSDGKLTVAGNTRARQRVPFEWERFSMPSIMKGDWRSFGTIQAKIWTQPASQLPHSQTSARTRLPHDSAMVDVWLTDHALLLVLPEATDFEHHSNDSEGNSAPSKLRAHTSIRARLSRRLRRSSTLTAHRDNDVPDFRDTRTQCIPHTLRGHPVTGISLQTACIHTITANCEILPKRTSNPFISILPRLSSSSTVVRSAPSSLSRSSSRMTVESKSTIKHQRPRVRITADKRKSKPIVLDIGATCPDGKAVTVQLAFSDPMYAQEAYDLVWMLDKQIS